MRQNLAACVNRLFSRFFSYTLDLTTQGTLSADTCLAFIPKLLSVFLKQYQDQHTSEYFSYNFKDLKDDVYNNTVRSSQLTPHTHRRRTWMCLSLNSSREATPRRRRVCYYRDPILGQWRKIFDSYSLP